MKRSHLAQPAVSTEATNATVVEILKDDRKKKINDDNRFIILFMTIFGVLFFFIAGLEAHRCHYHLTDKYLKCSVNRRN